MTGEFPGEGKGVLEILRDPWDEKKLTNLSLVGYLFLQGSPERKKKLRMNSFQRLTFLRSRSMFALVVLVTLLIVYLLEFHEEIIKRNFPEIVPLIIFIHFLFMICGLIMIGLPFSYLLRQLVMKSMPIKLLPYIRESCEKYALVHSFLDYILWIVILPIIFSGVIFYVLRIILSFNVFYSFYVLPPIGIIFLVLEDKIKGFMKIQEVS